MAYWMRHQFRAIKLIDTVEAVDMAYVIWSYVTNASIARTDGMIFQIFNIAAR